MSILSLLRYRRSLGRDFSAQVMHRRLTRPFTSASLWETPMLFSSSCGRHHLALLPSLPPRNTHARTIDHHVDLLVGANGEVREVTWVSFS